MTTLGVVEGFYGRSWSEDQRSELQARLPVLGYSSYIYAPKADKALRSSWREPWHDQALHSLVEQAEHARRCGLRWTVGLSPLGLGELNQRERGCLSAKLKQLEACKPDSVCLLFDDMPGADKKLAIKQLAIIEHVANSGVAEELLICPTYYSSDAILEKVFGERPKDYWLTLGAGMDPAIGFFWTGEKVCSDSFEARDLDAIAQQMQRRPILWDNYPVNDSEKLSQFLRIKPFSGREPWLKDYVAGHYCNPMNQPTLSRLALATLAPIYDCPAEEDLAMQVQRCWQRELSAITEHPERIVESLLALSEQGLAGMSENETKALQARFAGERSAAFEEILDWLGGGYTFDPNCLTE